MLSIDRLKKTDSFILFELPPGKPNANQACRAGKDSRGRVIQQAYKGNTCWYYTFNFIRSRVGKVYDDEFKNARDIEIICSQRRKAQTEHENSLPAIADQLCTETGISFLRDINLDKAKFVIANKATLQPLETPEILEGCPSLFPFMEEFIKENNHNNMHEFLLEKKFGKRNEINITFLKKFEIDPKKMFEAEIRPEHGYKKMDWEKIDLVTKAAFLGCFAHRVSAEKYGLKISAWTPLQPIDSLIKELTLHGPLAILGAFGQSAYIDRPFKMSQRIQGRDVYAWKPGAKRHVVTFLAHSVLLVGAKKVQEKAFVYFIDSKDKNDPKDKSSQKLYMISYTNLTQYICDLHGRMMPNSSLDIGYGYYGNFQLK